MSEPIKEAATPQEMRAEIFRLRFHDPLVRRVMDSADVAGWSSEDRYTMLAYYALVEKARYQDMALDQAMLRPAPILLTTNDSAATIERLRALLAHAVKAADDWHDANCGGPIANDPLFEAARIEAGLGLLFGGKVTNPAPVFRPEDIEGMATEAGGVLRSGELCFAPRALAEFAQTIAMRSRLNALSDFSNPKEGINHE